MIETGKQLAGITYESTVLNADGSVAYRRAPKRNLLLDSGLNNLATLFSWASSFTNAVLGTGTTPVKRDSGIITFTRSGNVVTASAGFFETQDVGRLLKFDSGEEMYVTVFTSATQVTVNTSGTLAASEGTVWYVNVTGHQAEVKRSNTYANDSGDNGTSWNGVTGVVSMWRTFIFTAEAAPITYREIGWSHTATAGANLFGRDLIAGGGDSLIAGQQYKVKVQLDITIAPLTEQTLPALVTGWPTGTAKSRIEGVALNTVATSGNNSGSNILEPFFAGEVSVGTSTAVLTPPVLGPSSIVSGGINSLVLTADAYSAGSFTRTYRGTFSLVQANSTALRCVQLIQTGTGGCLRILFDSNQTKTSSQTLTLIIRKSWGRVLIN
jgi:hypothetical protein